jgi:MraZ protein
MFIGEYQHNLDTKARLAIPAKFRNQLSGGAIITRGLDRCLFVFTSKDWEILAGKLIALPLVQADSRAFVRLMLAGAAECDIDSQGRVLVPEYLRKYADLKKEVVITGLYNRIEIWDSEVWSSYKKKTEGASEEIAEHLRDLGI